MCTLFIVLLLLLLLFFLLVLVLQLLLSASLEIMWRIYIKKARHLRGFTPSSSTLSTGENKEHKQQQYEHTEKKVRYFWDLEILKCVYEYKFASVYVILQMICERARVQPFVIHFLTVFLFFFLLLFSSFIFKIWCVAEERKKCWVFFYFISKRIFFFRTVSSR